MAYSALILAGGRGKRMGYKEKALMDINGKPLITYAIKKLEKVVDSIIISVRDKAQGELLNSVLPGYTLTYDSYENTGPLAGLLSGLMVCRDEFCFIAACDMPLINEKVVKMLFSRCENYEAAIPCWEDGFLEPLHAVYKCKPMILETKKAITKGETIILSPVYKLKVNYIKVEDIRKIDPDLRTFINLNIPEDISQFINNLSS